MNQSQIQQLAQERGLSVEELQALARSTFGAMGGKSGTGEAKRRDPEHYRRMVQKRNEQRAKKKKLAASGK